MARTVCSAGVVKSVSYYLFDHGNETIATVNTPDKQMSVRHTEMDVAKAWLDKKLDEMLKVDYEAE